MDPFQNSTAFSMRGVSFADKDTFFDPPIGVVVADFGLARNVDAVLELYDVEHVEILRGPQGTLFGTNTIGGVLIVRSHRPDAGITAPAARMRHTFGSHDLVDLRAAADVPIVTGALAATLAIMIKQSDGFFTNEGSDKDLGSRDLRAGRAVLRYEPSADLDITFSADFFSDDSGSAPLNNASLPTQVLPRLGYPSDDGDPTMISIPRKCASPPPWTAPLTSLSVVCLV